MKLLLVDGSALLHRAYHAYPPLTNKKGQVVGAVYGVSSMLVSAIESVAPTHVVVAWDLPKPTFRHEKYVAYKAQRPKADLEMVRQIPMVKEIIHVMGIVQVEQEGYEADDILGTLSVTGLTFGNNQEESEVVILTGDQDTMQLVRDGVSVLTPAKGQNPPKLYTRAEVKEKYGVEPSQIVDYKALIGDSSDNIPGVAGIGPKTAAKLIQAYNSLDGVYGAVERGEIESVVAQKLVTGKDSAELSRELSEIVTDMDLPMEWESTKYLGLKNDVVREKFEEMGFRSLVRRIFGEIDKKPKFDDKQMGLF
ncbi:MAG: polymerase protein [Microgenomates group bacterium GW2011_GWF2_47_9]|nr:MAG: polymerase protein [Microgenomates group bacterium GW2011_GWF2_47_9]